jgi:hypothetical protein
MFMLGIALALGGAFASQSLARAIVASRNASSIKVKGSASVDLQADRARWGATVTARGATLQAAYQQLGAGMAGLQGFVTKAGFTDKEWTTSAVRTATVMKKDAKGAATNTVERYELSQAVVVTTDKVSAVYEAARTVTELIKDGTDVTSGAPEYTVSTVEDAKVRLLDQATRSAMDRARTLADGSGSAVGALLNASQGVIQIVSRGSTSGGEYGEYDTSTIDKTMRVVVSLASAVRCRASGGKHAAGARARRARAHRRLWRRRDLPSLPGHGDDGGQHRRARCQPGRRRRHRPRHRLRHAVLLG